MFKTIKAQARAVLLQNYKYFLLPTLLFVFSNAVSYLIFNVFSDSTLWNNLHIVLQSLLLILFLLCEFVGWPLAVTLIFKISIVLTDKKDQNVKAAVKNFLNTKNIAKITVINFIPRQFAVFFDIKDVTLFGLQIPQINTWVLIILALVGTYIVYRFFVCNYHFALNEASVKETVTASIKTTKNTLGKYISWYLSFVLWDLLVLGIFIVLKLLIYTGQITLSAYSAASEIYTPVLDVLGLSFGFGINLYVVPYMYVTLALFIDGLLKASANREKKYKKRK